MGGVALLGGRRLLLLLLLQGSAGTHHHHLWTTLGLIHVCPSSSHRGGGLWRNPLGRPHPSWPRVSHGHLGALALLMVRRHQARLSLQRHLPLSVGNLLDSHRDFHRCGGGPRRGLLLLLGDRGLALRLTGRMLASNISRHHRGAGLLLGRRYGTKDGFALGLMDGGGPRGSVSIQRHVVVMLLKWLRFGPRSALLLQLDMGQHRLLMLGGAHHPPRSAASTAHLLELIVKGVLRGPPTWLLLLLDASDRAQPLLGDRRHSLSRGLRCWGLGSTGCWGAGRCGAVVPWRWKSNLRPHWGSSGRLPRPLHARHSPAQHLGLLQSVLQLLLPQLLLDVQAERDGTFVLLAVFGVVAAQGDELLADGTAAVGLALAAFRVLHHALHLLAGRQRAVGVATLARVHQRLDAALDTEAAGVSRALGGRSSLVVAVIVQSEPQLVHLVHVTFSIVASDAQVIVLKWKKKPQNI